MGHFIRILVLLVAVPLAGLVAVPLAGASQDTTADIEIIPHHIGISVPDLDESIAWYGRMLGFEAVRQPPPRSGDETRIALLRRGNAYIELFEIPAAEPLPEYRRDPSADLRVHGIKHFSFEVDDAPRALEILREKGAEIALELRDNERTSYFFVRDNSGNTFELIQYKNP